MAPLALSSQTSDALHAIIAKATSDPQHQLPRLVVMAASPTSLLYSGAGGVEQLPPAGSSIADSPPATPDSIFELWSCTKLVSCISALQLVEQSKIGLLDAASKYLPELGNVRIFKGMDEEGEPVLEVNTVPITIEMLINHTAGYVKAAPSSLQLLKHEISDSPMATIALSTTSIAPNLVSH